MAITPASYNIRPQRRADFELQIQFKDSTGTAINISGWSVVAQCWNKDRTTKQVDCTVTIVNASTGTVKIKLPQTVTINLPDEAYYDVMLIDSSGLREYYLEGIVRPSEGYSAP